MQVFGSSNNSAYPLPEDCFCQKTCEAGATLHEAGTTLECKCGVKSGDKESPIEGLFVRNSSMEDKASIVVALKMNEISLNVSVARRERERERAGESGPE